MSRTECSIQMKLNAYLPILANCLVLAAEPLLHEPLHGLPAEDVAGAPAHVPLLFHYRLVLAPEMHRVVWILCAQEIPVQRSESATRPTYDYGSV